MKKFIKVTIILLTVYLILCIVNSYQLYIREKNTYTVELKQEMFSGEEATDSENVPDYVIEYIMEESSNGETRESE